MRVTDKIISLDAAKFLGLPFTWAGGVYACKFVHTDAGLELRCKGICDYGVQRFGDTLWVAPDEGARTAVRYIEDGIGLHLWLVEEDFR